MSTRSRTFGIALVQAFAFAFPGGLAHSRVATAQYAPEPLATEAFTPEVVVSDRSGLVVGERMEYVVRLGRLRLGTATLAVEALEEIAGIPAYRAALEIHIGAAMLKVEDRLVSWIAPQPLRSVAFEKRDTDTESGRRRYDFDRDALDELAALFLMRTLPLQPGTTFETDRYFSPAGNPISFRVVGHEKVRVPAGRFETIVIEPVIPALSTFRANSGARIYVTDDERRVIVQMETRTKVGKLTLYMTEYEAGTLP